MQPGETKSFNGAFGAWRIFRRPILPFSAEGPPPPPHFWELFPNATLTTYIAAETLTLWYAMYGMPDTLQFDEGTPFRNEMLKHLSVRLKVELSFSSVYSPWLNGTVKRLTKDIR